MASRWMNDGHGSAPSRGFEERDPLARGGEQRELDVAEQERPGPGAGGHDGDGGDVGALLGDDPHPLAIGDELDHHLVPAQLGALRLGLGPHRLQGVGGTDAARRPAGRGRAT